MGLKQTRSVKTDNPVLVKTRHMTMMSRIVNYLTAYVCITIVLAFSAAMASNLDSRHDLIRFYLGTASLFVFFRPLRRMARFALIAALWLTIPYVLVADSRTGNAATVDSGNVELASALNPLVVAGPGLNLKRLVTEWKKFDRPMLTMVPGAIARMRAELADGPTALSKHYRQFSEAVSARDRSINELASVLVERCDVRNTACIADRLLHYVATRIEYRDDPRGKEYVKIPDHTLQAGAGDCEDQAILLAALLETLGIQTYLGFSSNHLSVMVCFSKPLQDAPYFQIEDLFCHNAEPTNRLARIGDQPRKSYVMLWDPIEHRPALPDQGGWR
jgi:hypothetical protein